MGDNNTNDVVVCLSEMNMFHSTCRNTPVHCQGGVNVRYDTASWTSSVKISSDGWSIPFTSLLYWPSNLFSRVCSTCVGRRSRDWWQRHVQHRYGLYTDARVGTWDAPSIRRELSEESCLINSYTEIALDDNTSVGGEMFYSITADNTACKYLAQTV